MGVFFFCAGAMVKVGGGLDEREGRRGPERGLKPLQVGVPWGGRGVSGAGWAESGRCTSCCCCSR